MDDDGKLASLVEALLLRLKLRQRRQGTGETVEIDAPDDPEIAEVEALLLAGEKGQLEKELAARVKAEADAVRRREALDELKRRGAEALAAGEAAQSGRVSERSAEPPSEPVKRRRRRRRDAPAGTPSEPAPKPVTSSKQVSAVSAAQRLLDPDHTPAPYELVREDGSRVVVDCNDPNVGPNARR